MRTPLDRWRIPQSLAVYWLGFIPAYFCAMYLEALARGEFVKGDAGFWDQLSGPITYMTGFLFVVGFIAIPILRWGMTRIADHWSRPQRLSAAIVLYPLGFVCSGAAMSLLTSGVLYGGLALLLSPWAFVICMTLLAVICEFPDPQSCKAGAAA